MTSKTLQSGATFSGLLIAATLLIGQPLWAADKAPAKGASKGSAKGVVELKLTTKGDELYFDKASLSAKPGATVKLTFKNGASASSNMQHNVVVLKPGKVEEISEAAITAGPDKGYIPDSPSLIAHTSKLVDPGKS